MCCLTLLFLCFIFTVDNKEQIQSHRGIGHRRGFLRFGHGFGFGFRPNRFGAVIGSNGFGNFGSNGHILTTSASNLLVQQNNQCPGGGTATGLCAAGSCGRFSALTCVNGIFCCPIMNVCQPGFTYTGNQCISGLCFFGSFCNIVTGVCCSPVAAFPAETVSDGLCLYGVCQNQGSICLGTTCCISAAAVTTTLETTDTAASSETTTATPTQSTDATTTALSAEQCRSQKPGNVDTTDMLGAYCIVHINEMFTWKEGKERCAEIPNGSLLHIRSKESHQELLTLLTKWTLADTRFWIGLFQLDSSTTSSDGWQWQHPNGFYEDVNDVSLLPWATNEPNGGSIGNNKNCAAYHESFKKLFDLECIAESSIMCQFTVE